MPFILDASVVGTWAFDDEEHPTAALALDRLRRDPALVPGLWWFETRNLLVMNERRGRLTEAATAAFLARIAQFRIGIDRSPDESAVLTLARKHRLTVYDSGYLELALRQSASLATQDARLARAAQAEGVALVGA